MPYIYSAIALIVGGLMLLRMNDFNDTVKKKQISIYNPTPPQVEPVPKREDKGGRY